MGASAMLILALAQHHAGMFTTANGHILHAALAKFLLINNIFCVCVRSGVPLAVFAFSSHSVVLPVFREMRKQTLSEFTRVSAISYALVLLCYALSGLAGYFMFSGTVNDGNILNMFMLEGHKDELIGLVCTGLCCVGICMLCVYVYM